MRTIAEIQGALVVACMIGLAAIGLAVALHRLLSPLAALALRAVRASVWRAAFLAVFACAFIFYGATKGTISFPYTDFEKRYLVDNGSYVTNDFIHVNFTRIIAPSSADFHIDYRQTGSTNDEEWATLVDTTFGEFTVPQDIPFPMATNFDFAAYTTWTPGAAVQTNGVWHSYWGLDHKLHFHMIPVRTVIRLDGTTIATPKSREDAKHD